MKTLRTYLKSDLDDEPRRFGIVVDADTNLLSRWQRLRDILGNLDYSTVPISPESEGTVIKEEGRPIVGIWLMPDNTFPGMLEDFASFLVPSSDLLWPIAEDILQQVTERDCRFRPTYRIKAKIHTWLAWQEEPGKPMGQAITARYLDATAPHAQQLVAWVRQLFDLGSS